MGVLLYSVSSVSLLLRRSVCWFVPRFVFYLVQVVGEFFVFGPRSGLNGAVCLFGLML